MNFGWVGMSVKSVVVAAIALAASYSVNSRAQEPPPDDHLFCDRLWVNAFHPEQPVYSTKSEGCRQADERRPLFTREGTLACSALEGFQLAYNAMEHDWHYVQTAGVTMRSGEYNGMTVTPE